MPYRLTLGRRLGTAARWPMGIALTSWRYMWRTTPMHRAEVEGSIGDDAPPELPPAVDRTEIQTDGTGPLFHRRYRTRIRGSGIAAAELIRRVSANPDAVAPSEFASFQKVRGEADLMAVGDEYVVRMPGPWDGPVRVVDRGSTSFRLATLDGHLESGQIEFRASEEGHDLEFEIESWARSADRLSDLLYDRLRMSKEVQLHMWTSTLERVARLAGGRMKGGIEIHTRKVPSELSIDDRASRGRRIRRALTGLGEREVNFDPTRLSELARGDPWHIDDYRRELPPEPPGPPVAGGSFEIARRLMRDYEFADPGVVRAFYDRDAPLEGRDMLLEIRFAGLRFPVGLRVAVVHDETCEVEGRPLRLWGWAYRTLEGHLERGQMDYQVWKWLDDGRVEFRVHAVSEIAEIDNPLVRLGFRIFGRREQVRFARRCAERMVRLTEAALASDAGSTVEPETIDGVTVSPTGRA
jgi:uncharacterized protein (UPF0548 family)